MRPATTLQRQTTIDVVVDVVVVGDMALEIRNAGAGGMPIQTDLLAVIDVVI